MQITWILNMEGCGFRLYRNWEFGSSCHISAALCVSSCCVVYVLALEQSDTLNLMKRTLYWRELLGNGHAFAMTSWVK
jgi:hypothetical protein